MSKTKGARKETSRYKRKRCEEGTSHSRRQEVDHDRNRTLLHETQPSSVYTIKPPLHDLILSQAAVRICVHDVVSALVEILHEAQVERATAVLITLELGDGGLSGLG
jgi:hypothetical protein